MNINITAPSNVNVTGNITTTDNVITDNDVIANGISFTTHVHGGVTSGFSNIGGPV